MTFDPTGSESQITLTRTIAAPVEDVFAAWTDPALLEQWQADEVETEPFEGGEYRYFMAGDAEDPTDLVVTGRYIEFVENERLVMSWVASVVGDDDGNAEDGEGQIFVLEIDFREVAGGGTSITIVERGLAHADAESRIFSIEAWSQAIEHLAELME
ncbi:hypothetical protein VE25_16350 [Devosia geojensis]|uniref:Activator of Hsp90 ATPase homologue 1/2-like C-terminal domain-containing protein n=1 Tax=Devosia geojensis TaxID=443610 RepID=A0A0F5FQA3_9HYPH|nr:SRPBCC domain-containing protein [Devosia geojensis]KKB10760.1 hypothetical protein VE25_16350 [Devosia geojensis]